MPAKMLLFWGECVKIVAIMKQRHSPADARETTSSEEKVPEKENVFGEESEEKTPHRLQTLEHEIEEKNRHDNEKKRRNWWIKTVLMLILIAGSVAIMFTMSSLLSSEETKGFSEMIRGMDPLYFLLFVGIILLYMLVESSKYAYLIRIQTGKWRIRVAIKTMYLGKYYDGITPFGTGGQPFQIYYLHKKKIPAGVATNVPLSRYMMSSIVHCSLAAVALVLAGCLHFLDGPDGKAIIIITSVFLFFNIAIPIALIFVSVFPRIGKKIIVWFVWVLSKIRLVKHKYPTMKKYVYEVEQYRQSLKAVFRRWWTIFPFFFICVAEVVLYAAMPFFATLAILGPEVSSDLPALLFRMCCLTLISFYAASLMPTPGNSGASEAMTTLIFLTVSGIHSVLGWVVLLWRFANYYIYILSGIGINIFEIVRSYVRNRKLLRGKEDTPTQESPSEEPPSEENSAEEKPEE